jgi:hypothetical protein
MPSLASFTGVKVENVDRYWELVEPLIKSGLGEGENITDAYNDILSGHNQLWIAYRDETLLAACITELCDLGQRKVCNIRSIGGTAVNDWLDYIEIIEAWAKQNGCSSMRFPIIRKGWARILKHYHTTHIVLEREL